MSDKWDNNMRRRRQSSDDAFYKWMKAVAEEKEEQLIPLVTLRMGEYIVEMFDVKMGSKDSTSDECVLNATYKDKMIWLQCSHGLISDDDVEEMFVER